MPSLTEVDIHFGHVRMYVTPYAIFLGARWCSGRAWDSESRGFWVRSPHTSPYCILEQDTLTTYSTG